jgi:hypothetical protein
MDVLQKMTEAIASVPFPVYGVVGEPLGLQLQGYAPHLGVPGISIGYKSPRYPDYFAGRNHLPTFRVLSDDAKRFSLHARDGYLEHVIEEQEQPVEWVTSGGKLCRVMTLQGWDLTFTLLGTRYDDWLRKRSKSSFFTRSCTPTRMAFN